MALNSLRIARKALFASFAHAHKAQSNSYCSSQSKKFLEQLENRSLIRVVGLEASDFLQGLITNDMGHFEDGAASIYTLFLNIKGRVMCESVIYKTPDTGIFFVECDTRIVENLQKHLKMYKIRRKVDIEPMANRMRVWSAFDAPVGSASAANLESSEGLLNGQIFPCGSVANKSSKLADDIMIYEDPRIPETSLRILSDENVPKDEIVKHLGFEVAESGTSERYRSFRYRLGIAEGIDDLPPGKALPLEINCDYMHGVSFHKGCYIGQELTARTHHTGVVRKRIMPLILEDVGKAVPYDEVIVNEAGKSVGKFRGHEGVFGIGLMRISEALSAQKLEVRGSRVNIVKPSWWPKEPQKDKATADSGK